jgi:hypothetical protein
LLRQLLLAVALLQLQEVLRFQQQTQQVRSGSNS